MSRLFNQMFEPRPREPSLANLSPETGASFQTFARPAGARRAPNERLERRAEYSRRGRLIVLVVFCASPPPTTAAGGFLLIGFLYLGRRNYSSRLYFRPVLPRFRGLRLSRSLSVVFANKTRN